MKIEIGGRIFKVPEGVLTAVILSYASWMLWVSLGIIRIQGDIGMIKDRFYKLDVAAREWPSD